MEFRKLSDEITVSPQIEAGDLEKIKQAGFRAIVCHRPDGEAADQPSFAEIEKAAKEAGLEVRYQPVTSGKISDQDIEAYATLVKELPKPVFAYCRTGTRSTSLWALSQAASKPLSDIVSAAQDAGYDMSGIVRRIANKGRTPTALADATHEIVIVGGGAAGIATASSLLARDPDLDIAIIDPADTHYYQPGWTLVGAGVFDPSFTVNTMASVIPSGVKWIKAAVTAFEPKDNAVILEGCRVVQYKWLVVCPGIKLDWDKVEGLPETLGRNGVTSNYRFDLAPYTWELVSNFKEGKAVFTQPPMPIKCAGAPQKVMYLSADHWLRSGHLKDIDVGFYNAGGVLFGVADYVPALMEYVERYHAALNFHHNLVAIDGPAKKAWFSKTLPDTPEETVEVPFDMIHVTPPQCAPDFIRVSPLANEAGWVSVDQETLRHTEFSNIFALGDVSSAPNAKTAAAARKQAPVVAQNLIHDISGKALTAAYDGYGSCPLTVENGKIVLAEFGYGGKLMPSFPSFFIDGKKPSRMAWWLKERILPPIYWRAMLKGHEWLAKPKPSQGS
ncbi:TIGR01244 family sulfur transferase [Methyloligella sp. 2.7D]|uniref:bifunctional protein tyrosine phosphatase family protein/NAD(P)/FAD-dependent oxidoreductase n=1 Tax=unclassified Methyloligella TaxID=2625955 RepID=UPI00157DEBAA|nr:bifunctional protein tyrosine phosphatase family protein/NAD(P)/FAD-dependent oxidoreductase [Methyloligella sp. GL2]QKP78106.1 TIGR01244 family phosphatase [Methyloligella sp. GL2]